MSCLEKWIFKFDILMSCLEKYMFKFQFCFNEIKTMCSSLNINFRHVYQSAYDMMDALAKLGID